MFGWLRLEGDLIGSTLHSELVLRLEGYAGGGPGCYQLGGGVKILYPNKERDRDLGSDEMGSDILIGKDRSGQRADSRFECFTVVCGREASSTQSR